MKEFFRILKLIMLSIYPITAVLENVELNDERLDKQQSDGDRTQS